MRRYIILDKRGKSGWSRVVEIILFIIIVSVLFPGSGGGGTFELVMIPLFILCAAIILGFFAAITYAAAFVFEATGSGWIGLAAWFGLFFGACFANRSICLWVERRQAAKAMEV